MKINKLKILVAMIALVVVIGCKELETIGKATEFAQPPVGVSYQPSLDVQDLSLLNLQQTPKIALTAEKVSLGVSRTLPSTAFAWDFMLDTVLVKDLVSTTLKWRQFVFNTQTKQWGEDTSTTLRTPTWIAFDAVTNPLTNFEFTSGAKDEIVALYACRKVQGATIDSFDCNGHVVPAAMTNEGKWMLVRIPVVDRLDLNNDGVVNLADADVLLSALANPSIPECGGGRCDVDKNGLINNRDLEDYLNVLNLRGSP